MHKFLYISILVVISLLTGCSQKALEIDVSESMYRPTKISKIDINSLNITNKAEGGKFINTLLFSDTIIPIEPNAPTDELVENDIKTFFSNYQLTKDSKKVLNVYITNADAYVVWGGAQKIPIVGLLFVAADTDYVMNLRVIFEIEENGKVLNSYQFNDKIKIRHSAAVENSIVEGYQLLIEAYRQKLFNELENRFVHRYI